MDAVDFLKGQVRMCKKEKCSNCGIGKNGACSIYKERHPREVVAIVEQWVKDNPPRTRKDVFLERFPDAPLNESGVPFPCIQDLWDLGLDCKTLGSSCLDCWLDDIPEIIEL